MINEFSNKFISEYFNEFNNKFDNIKNETISLIINLYSSNSLNSKKNIIKEFISQQRDIFFYKMWMDYAKKVINNFFFFVVIY